MFIVGKPLEHAGQSTVRGINSKGNCACWRSTFQILRHIYKYSNSPSVLFQGKNPASFQWNREYFVKFSTQAFGTSSGQQETTVMSKDHTKNKRHKYVQTRNDWSGNSPPLSVSPPFILSCLFISPLHILCPFFILKSVFWSCCRGNDLGSVFPLVMCVPTSKVLQVSLQRESWSSAVSVSPSALCTSRSLMYGLQFAFKGLHQEHTGCLGYITASPLQTSDGSVVVVFGQKVMSQVSFFSLQF